MAEVEFNSVERTCFRIYQGNTLDLQDGMIAMDLIIEQKRSDAAHHLAEIIKDKLMTDGYLVVSDIDDSLFEFHQSESIGQPETLDNSQAS